MENTTQETAPVAQEQVQETQPQTTEQPIPAAEVAPAQDNKIVFKGVTTGLNVQEQPSIFSQQEQPKEQVQEQQTAQQPVAEQVANDEGVIYRDDAPEGTTAAESKTEIDPYDLLGVKEDEYFRKLVEAYKNQSLDDFLIRTNIDYDSMNDAEIYAMELQKQFPTLEQDDLNLLLEKKLQREFNLGSGDESDERVGRLLLKAEADRIRDGLKAEQAQYAPKPNPNSIEAKLQEQQAMQQKIAEEFNNYVAEHPVTKQLETSRLVQYGVGDTKLNYEVNQNVDLKSLAVDSNKFFSMFVGPDGKVDIQKFYKVANYAASMEGVEKALINLGRSQGEKRLYDELKNTKVSDNLSIPSGGNALKIKSIDGKPFSF